ncbi:hypothetical protein KQX54_008047 [Cotesia glomerata]|uniref:Uncharacterized protein n=1 Tax=Cotesia glomerata TaxID=32391 RepID=A0AAV7HQ82_COTGL|nr:hypothetical protein KQX54_008047 [Cotesia glomerata]
MGWWWLYDRQDDVANSLIAAEPGRAPGNSFKVVCVNPQLSRKLKLSFARPDAFSSHLAIGLSHQQHLHPGQEAVLASIYTGSPSYSILSSRGEI